MNASRQNDGNGWRLPAFLALSFVAMVIWPILGIAASYSMFDLPSESLLLFGGLRALLLFPIHAIFALSETLFGIAIVAIWLVTWIGSALCSTSRFMSESTSRRSQTIVLAALSGISLVQAALGYL